MENPTEESGHHCALCLVFLSADKVKLCGGCKRRAYCSKECSTKDWSVGKHGQVHKNWCKLECGEEDLDWEVATVPGKGLGVVAKRLIPKKSQIMVDAARPKSHPGIQGLVPLNGSTAEKLALNGLYDGKGGTIVCLRIARLNHDCYANADHYYDLTFNVKILFANRDIQKGEEICINYTAMHDFSKGVLPELARFALSSHWGINCTDTCFCRNEENLKLVEKGRKMDSSILQHGLKGRIADALEKVDKLLELINSMGDDSVLRMRALNDGLQIGVAQKRSLPKAKDYIKEAYEIASTILGSPKSEMALKYKQYMMDPSTHPNYLSH